MIKIRQDARELARFERICSDIGVFTGREDAAGDTLHLARELEYVSAQTYDVLKFPMMARRIVPFVPELPEGASSYSFDMFDGVAKAEWITNWASLVGGASAHKFRFTVESRSFGSSYMYTVEDLRRAAFARTVNPSSRSLSVEEARLVRIGHEQFIEDLIVDGDSSRVIASTNGAIALAGLPKLIEALGFTLQDNAGHESDGTPHLWIKPRVGTWTSSTTGAQLVSDLEKLTSAVEQNTKQLMVADRLILPLAVKPLMKQPYSTTVDARTVETVFLQNQPANGVKSIDYWHKFDNKSASTGPRAMAYKASPDTFKFVYSFDFREHPVQQTALALQVPTEAKVVGLVSVFPFGMAQMDLDGSPP